MAKLADAPDSKSGVCKNVWVQIPLSVPIIWKDAGVRLNGIVLKTVDGKPSVGSNPTPSPTFLLLS